MKKRPFLFLFNRLQAQYRSGAGQANTPPLGVGGVLLLFLSAAIRFWKLGFIPRGLSLEEAKLGLAFSNIFGRWTLDPFVIRLPFALAGVLSIYLFFVFISRLRKGVKLARVSSAILAFTPWHVQQSRIYSSGILILTGVLVLLILIWPTISKNAGKVVKLSLLFAACAFVFSVVVIPKGVRDKVDQQRSIAMQADVPFPPVIFSNKYLESFRLRQKQIFESLDFGNYFFQGHPRERWGVEEQQKLLIALLPLLILGFITAKNNLKWLMISGSFLVIVISTIAQSSGIDTSVLLLIPFALFSGLGISYLRRNSKYQSILLIILCVYVFELLIFFVSYQKGFNASMFSPRRSVYGELVVSVELNRRENERVLVSEKLVDPTIFFKFYLEPSSFVDYEFREFNIWKETDQDRMFVDVLTDNSSPSESLHTETGDWPEEISVLAEYYDKRYKHRIVVYRI